MTERPGFQFIPNPEGQALSDEQFVSSALVQQEQREHSSTNLFFGAALVVAVVLFTGLILWKRRVQ